MALLVLMLYHQRIQEKERVRDREDMLYREWMRGKEVSHSVRQSVRE